MKLCIALVICVVLVQHSDCHRRGNSERGTADEGDFDYNSQNQEQQRQPRNEAIKSKLAEMLSLLERQQWLHGSGAAASETSGHDVTLPDPVALRRKIFDRLDNSSILGSLEDVKRKLMQFANSKINECKTVGGNTVDKHCVGRVTGHIMQLIASLEKFVKNELNETTDFRNGN